MRIEGDRMYRPVLEQLEDRSVPNSAPVIDPIASVVMSASQDSITVPYVVSDADGDQVQVVGRHKNQEWYLNGVHGFYLDQGGTYQNWGGLNEKWLRGKNGAWFFVTPAGQLYQWDGSSQAAGVLVASVGSACWNDLGRLTAPVTYQVAVVQAVKGQVTVNPADGFVGTFYVILLASDGNGGFFKRTFEVNVV